ncbi:glycosyltransferase [Xenorhabdus hominickii]|uniref:Amylovoran biosynthesis protein AmsE n=1 Tax=Xenorhabdus hominickii TaxID=351679 RepID=A0A2G0QEU6_XENHO|nr:glycosyltransferase [Xenorhabdus hominickii]AOM41732.1 amylovoran biosynthesis protein AmsE [Xenorhabdus hominickii]PHM57689.1 putative UDP-galactose--lipooligosaccharide galactosyltransferase [Xenorhabdus hominickii]
MNIITNDNNKIPFSILMSLYKNENTKYLYKCLESLYEQKLQAEEIIIVFDGDIGIELETIVFEWKSKLPIKIVRIEKNVGLGQALNLGLLQCNNNIIARMDTDDICLPDRFIKQIPYIYQHQDIAVLGSNIFEYDEEISSLISQKSIPISHEDILKFIKKRNPFNHMSVVFRKNMIINSGSYQHHNLMEDYNLWIRVVSNGYKVENLPDRLLKVRAGNSMIKRRRGLDYIGSEYKLAKLKIENNIDNLTSIYMIFLQRSLIRILPISLLSTLYKTMRK